MPFADHHRPTAHECRGPGCRVRRPRGELRHGKFCSERCEDRRAGADALEAFRRDHRFCFTCGVRLKTVYRPGIDGRGINRSPKMDCGRATNDGDPCKLSAGWGTTNTVGPCKHHGGEEYNPKTESRPYNPGAYAAKRPPDLLDGWQLRTHLAAIGERVVDDDPLRIATGTVCGECGSTTPSARIHELFEPNADEYATRLLDASGVDVDREAFWAAFDGEDVEHAVGVALDDDPR